MNKKTNFLVVFSFLIVLVGTFVFTGCESSRVAPEVGRPNPPAEPAQPLVLTGTVVNSSTNSPVSGATVDIYKTDATKVATVATNGSGVFSYDISALNVTSLKITATASGYGSSFVMANVSVANQTADVVTIALDKLVSVALTVTPNGGTGSTTNTESKTSTPLSVNIPAGAVTSNTAITFSSVPVNNVPPPPASGSNTQVGVVSLQPTGITFAKAVELTFPLPYKFKPNDLIPLVKLVNGAWVTANLNAVVDATGYVAKVSVTETNQYALLDNTKITGTVSQSLSNYDDLVFAGPVKASKILADQSFTFSSGTLPVNLPGSVEVARAGTNVITEVPTDNWIFNTLAQRYGSEFKYTGPGTYNFTFKTNVAWPGASANPYKLNADGSGNVNRPTESGDWSLKVTYSSTRSEIVNIVLNNTGYWTITILIVENSWKESSRKWVWTAHNQGAVFEY